MIATLLYFAAGKITNQRPNRLDQIDIVKKRERIFFHMAHTDENTSGWSYERY